VLRIVELFLLVDNSSICENDGTKENYICSPKSLEFDLKFTLQYKGEQK
jgi:hypothetical protein